MSEDPQQITIRLPRITRGMKILSIYTVAVWLLLVVLSFVPHQGGALGPLHWLALIGSRIVPRFELWRMFSYVLIENPGNFSAVWDVVAFWLIGSPIEQASGMRRIVGLSLAGTVGGAVLVLLASRLSIEMLNEPVIGMAPITGALVVGWGFQYATQKVSFFGLGAMTGKQLSMALAGVSVFFAILSHTAMSMASIGGLAGGLVYMLAVSRGAGTKGRTDREGGPRKRRSSGERFKVIPGGRDDKHMWN